MLSITSQAVTFAGGDISGDEGQGFAAVSYLRQQGNLVLATVLTVARTTCNTLLTQNVTGSSTVQTVTVASTSGCTANDWVILNQQLPTNTPNNEAAQIISVGSGSLTMVIQTNQTSGATVTPALVLTVDDDYQFGENRVLVDHSGTTYSTGTVASISGAGFAGSGHPGQPIPLAARP